MLIAVAHQCCCRHRNQWRAAARAILAGVMALTRQRVGDERLTGRLHALTTPSGQRMGDNVYIVFLPPSRTVDTATACSACCKGGGNALPRFAARRSIP